MTTNPQRPSFLQPNDPAAEPALAVETERLRQALRQQPPEEIARRTGAGYTARAAGSGTLALNFWGAPVTLDFPGLVARAEPLTPLPLPVQALLAYYLTTSDGAIPAQDWVSFADLPDGRVYSQAFQGYTGSLLVRAFGEALDAFRRACLSAGGVPAAFGDAAFTFAALPRVPLLVTYWLGEEEIPSACRVLFDRTAKHHLPIEVCAILGSMLVSRVLKAHKAGPA